MDVASISSEDELNLVRQTKGVTRRTKFKITCMTCGKDEIKNLMAISYPFTCQHCNHKRSHNTSEYHTTYRNALLAKYGSYTYNNREQAKQTCIERYGGVGNASQLISEKCRKTCKEKYGVEYPMQIPEVMNQISMTKRDRYGDANYNNRPKSINTCLKKYGVEHVASLPEIIQKGNDTKLIRYGSATYNNRKSARQTCLEKYGVNAPMQAISIIHKARSKYTYNGIHFDSSYELAYYIWCVDFNYDVIYKPNVAFDYTYEGQSHKYNPDFLIDGKYVEIKGKQFFANKDPNSIMVNPYNHLADGLYEAKHQCMKQNNVNIITDCKIQMNYVRTTYGRDYLKQFKNKK